MNWVDVSGVPGAGKSTISYPLWGDKSVGWDGLNPPAHWQPFLDEITKLCTYVRDHPSFTAVLRMNARSARKMSTVYRMDDHRVFIQTGWLQRITGFGWRLKDLGRDVNLIRPAVRLMPVSVGVAFLELDEATAFARNRARRNVAETAHEDRSYQFPLMLPAIKIAKEVLHERGVRVMEIDVQHQSIDAARSELVAFADEGACDATPGRSGSEGTVLQPPPWW